MKKEPNEFVLVPDGKTSGLWCSAYWTPITLSGRVGPSEKDSRPLTSKQREELIAHTERAIADAEACVKNLTDGLTRLLKAKTVGEYP